MSEIKIDEESIKQLRDDLYGFSGSAKVLFVDKASSVGTSANVEFAGQVLTISEAGRTKIEDLLLTSFHRTTDILPK